MRWMWLYWWVYQSIMCLRFDIVFTGDVFLFQCFGWIMVIAWLLTVLGTYGMKK